MIIEDDSFLSGMYARKFEEQDFEAETAVSGEEGIKKIQENKPDVVLLDIILPKMDGFEVLRAIKENPALQKIVVILLTNLGQLEDLDRGVGMGAADYIIKAHFTPGAVVGRVKEILKKHKK